MSILTMNRLLERDDAATAVEYALLAASVAAVIAGTVLILGEKVVTFFSSVQF
jgi:Flp pilus assembly pilin Flp